MKILITGAGGAAAISVWKSLAKNHDIHMSDMDPCAAGLYLVPAEKRLILPPGKNPAFVQNLLTYCREKHIQVVIPTVDDELAPLASKIEEFSQYGIHMPLCPAEVLKICYDKYTLLTQCINLVPVPEFILLTDITKPTINHFPKFAKPRFSSGSRGIKLIEKFQDLDDLPTDGSYLIQELLPGEEYSVDVYIDSEGKALAAVPRVRMKIDSGIAVAARTQIIPELSTLALAVARHIGLRYVANIQFKRAQDNQFKLLEINPRFPGTLPLTTKAGIDIPKLLLRDLQGESLPDKIMPFREIMVVRYWTEHFFSTREWETICQNVPSP